MSSCSSVAEVSTSLCAPGNPVIWVRNDCVTVVGSATCTYPEATHWASCAVDDAMWTVMERALAGVPHHLGFCTRVIVEGATEPILKGPPDRSMSGFTVGQFGFHPTFSMTWAGTRLSKSICQSAKVVLNFTVTVWPPFVPATDAMSRYPAMLDTSGDDSTGSPRCSSHAYLKSAAVIGTPSDHTALGFSV